MSTSSKKANLLFVVTSSSYDDWLHHAFKPHSDRRSEFTDESRTQVYQLNEKQAIVLLYDFQITRMSEFASTPEMIKLSNTYQVKHEVYQFDSIGSIAPDEMPSTTILGFIVSSDGYDKWLTEAFNIDSDRRAKYCNESKTLVAQMNDTQAYVILYDFDMARFEEFAMEPEMMELIEQHSVKHDVYVLRPLN